MKKYVQAFLLLSLLVLVCILAIAQTGNKTGQTNSNESVQPKNQDPARPTYKPTEGYVPDEETAIAIAVAVWNPIYGKEKIEGEKPYKAILKDGVWTVTGSLPKQYEVGGVALAEISKDDGRILRVIHGK